MKKLILILSLIFCVSNFVSAQKSIGEWTKEFQQSGDSILISYFGEEFVSAHFKIDSNLSYITDFQNNGYHNYDFNHDPTVILADSITCTFVYKFYPDKKYGSSLIWISFDKNGTISFSTLTLDLLRLNLSRTFITDTFIENIALKELHLKPGEFYCEFDDGRYFGSKRQCNWSKRKQNRLFNQFLVKITKPMKYIWYYQSSAKAKLYGYIVVDAYTGEIVDKGISQKKRYGVGRLRAAHYDRNF